ncbi:MAG: ATP synthase F1 subunit epsilon [Endomicrobium sp.]|jgi:F-type H+-transporting ATPase subunit epsilon|nr:ATP synthase F1 subunit epsilon [Endomicrobium sp.]
MNKLKIEILSPEGIILKEDIISVSFPTTSGIITVLPGHINIVTKLNSGEIEINTIKDIKKIIVSGGFIEITDNNVNVVAEFAVQSDKEKERMEKIKEAIKLASDIKKKRKEFTSISTGMESQLKKAVIDLKSGLELRHKKYSSL